MLTVLHIENVAVIEAADIEFGPGLNVMTGETGAGKSIVIDAIGAVLGERTSRELIRTGASSALVSAAFSGADAASGWCAENGIVPDENGELLLLRRMSADGKNTCRVNGCPVTAAQLRALGRGLLNIHGQHDSLQLFDEGCQLRFVDSFGGVELSEYQTAFSELRALERELASLNMDEAEKERKKDVLGFQIAELERAALSPGEDGELEARRSILKNAGKISDAVALAFALFDGDEDTDGIYSMLMNAERALDAPALRGVSAEINSACERTRALRAEASDILETLRDINSSLDFSPEEYDRVETRLDTLRRLTRKYGAADSAALLEYLEKCRAELDAVEYAGDRAAKLQKRLDAKRADCEALAEGVSARRTAAAQKLTERILDELRDLDMPKIRLEIAFERRALGADGADSVSFLMSTNPGESLRPVSRIASGGELSRIMLAIKAVMSESDDVGTLIFDEVDSGVSGRAAQKVGAKLKSVARSRQVISVTHLPQVAACADTHLKIIKDTDGERTSTRVEELDGAARIEEVARIISGESVTEASRRHAEEMINEAK